MQLRLQKYAPASPLRALIRFYYVIETDSGPGDGLLLDNHPQGGIDLQFALSGHIRYSNARQEDTPLGTAFFIGQHDRNFRVRLLPGFRVVGVTFTAEGFGKLFDLPMRETANLGTGILDHLPPRDRFLLEQLAELPGDEGRVRLLDRYFCDRAAKRDVRFDTADHAIRRLRESAGRTTISELAEQLSTSTRTLQRKFNEKIGLGPKAYARIMRVNHALRLLKQAPAADWQDILFACGYFDQMHFIREFRAFTGHTPRRYLQSNTALGEFFLDD